MLPLVQFTALAVMPKLAFALNHKDMVMADIFKTVDELLDSRDCVLTGNAVQSDGALYDDSVTNLHALRMLEPSLRGLVDVCLAVGIDDPALNEIMDLMGY